MATSPADWPAFEAGVESALRNPAFTVATSAWVPAGEGLDGARRQAEAALRLGWATGGPRVVHFEELGLQRLLAAGGDHDGLRRFVQQWLGTLVDYDARRHSELMRTLTAYLDRGGSVERAAEALFVHPSTLSYRLARVGELTGFDLGDPDTRFQLRLALRSRAILESMGAAGG